MKTLPRRVRQRPAPTPLPATTPAAIPAATPDAAPAPTAGAPQRLRADELDPDSRVLLSLLNLSLRPDITRANLEAHRLAWGVSARMLGRVDTVAEVSDRRIATPDGSEVRLKLYHPQRPASETGTRPAFLWIHGGGFMVGGLPTADAICRHLARVSGAIVVAVRYRLAPEHDLYAGREDCHAALDWLCHEGSSVGIDSTRLAIGGDSAGGNIAAALAQRHTLEGRPGLRLQVLVYPATNLRDDFASRTENAEGYLLTSSGMDAIRALMIAGDPDLSDPWLSPALRADLRGLPPALMVLAGFDPVRDDGLSYAARLREAGVPVDLLHYAGQFHGFLNFNGVLRAARDALDRIGAGLRRVFDVSADAVPLTDRTTELAVRETAAPVLTGLRLGRDAMLFGLMLAERMEAWRAASLRSVLPGLGPLTDLPAWLYPASALRVALAETLGPLEARETYLRTSCAPP